MSKLLVRYGLEENQVEVIDTIKRNIVEEKMLDEVICEEYPDGLLIISNSFNECIRKALGLNEEN